MGCGRIEVESEERKMSRTTTKEKILEVSIFCIVIIGVWGVLFCLHSFAPPPETEKEYIDQLIPPNSTNVKKLNNDWIENEHFT